jgi:hypothetical protein
MMMMISNADEEEHVMLSSMLMLFVCNYHQTLSLAFSFHYLPDHSNRLNALE